MGASAKKFALQAQNTQKMLFSGALGELFRGNARNDRVLGELFRGCQKDAAKEADAAVTHANLRESQESPHAASNDLHAEAPGAVAPGAPGNN